MNNKNDNKTVATLTLGCKVNQYETDAIEQIMENYGYKIVDFSAKADYYIVNTCSVTNIADRKSRQMLHKAKKLNPNAVVIAMGCYVQAAKEILEQDSSIDIVIGNNKKKDILQIIEEYENTNNNEDVIDIFNTKEYEELTLDKVVEHTRAYIKIQDGCNQFCSYCIIPYTRGRARSRQKQSIIDEINRIVSHGFKEVVLTGIHLSSYGRDLENTSLLDLVLEITKIEGISRIRLGSLEPGIITEEFVNKLKDNKKFCPHFHLSLQSGCDATLKRMNRHYSTKEYMEKCDLIREYFNRPALTTDIIVGFPGETKEEFEQTYEYLKELNLYEMHIFKYSIRQGTNAAKMTNQVDDKTKSIRSNLLLELTSINKEKFEDGFIGEKVSVLIEEKIVINDSEYFVGHTKRYVKVAIPADEREDLVNEIIDVSIINRLDKTYLFGELIS